MLTIFQSDTKLPLVSYPALDLEYVDYTAQQLDNFAFWAARSYGPDIVPRLDSNAKPSVIAMLGQPNFDYLVTILGLQKLGHTILFLSTRIPQEAYINLLEDTGSTQLLTDGSFDVVGKQLQLHFSGLRVHRIGPVKPTTLIPKQLRILA